MCLFHRQGARLQSMLHAVSQERQCPHPARTSAGMNYFCLSYRSSPPKPFISFPPKVSLFLNAWCLLHFSLFFPVPSPVVLHCHQSKHTRTFFHNSSQDQVCQKQTAVVLLNNNGKTCTGSGGFSVTTLGADVLPSSKHAKQRDWLSLIRTPSVNIRPPGSLRFSMSLNDMGQRVDSLCRGLRFIDRTCSEGELELKPEPAQPPNTDQRAHTLNGKLATASINQNPYIPFPTRTNPHLIPSFTNNHKYMLGNPSACGLPSNPTIIALPPLSHTHLHPHPSPSANFLRRLLPFSRSSTSASLQCSDLGSYTSHLHITKSSSALEGSESGFPIEELQGDDDVFEEERLSSPSKSTGQQAAPGTVTDAGMGAPLAPLCYMDEDSDLDCCTLTEKVGPLSPYSLSGDCCRWVTVWMV